MPQDTIPFNSSLIYNLLYVKPDTSVSEVYKAYDAVRIHDKILSFPDSYETAIEERGLRLSSGEKQRVSYYPFGFSFRERYQFTKRGTIKITIARAILRKPQILLLDKATASQDSRTER